MPNNNRCKSEALAEQTVNDHMLPQVKQQAGYELRTEEVQDIMTKMPSWIIMQGTTVLFTVIVLLFAGAYFIHFPDVVTARVNIKPVYTESGYSQTRTKLSYMATAILPEEIVGKVKTGQEALIKLPLYPFEQFGAIEGTVEAISANDTATAYTIKIRLTKGLVTNTKKTINYGPSLSGIAEVLTSDKTILQRLFETIHRN